MFAGDLAQGAATLTVDYSDLVKTRHEGIVQVLVRSSTGQALAELHLP